MSLNKDQIAIYLNEHLEFFNEYPELLEKIKSIEETDLPLKPQGTLNLTDRILKKVHDDKEHLKSKLEWFVEICQANDKIHEHLFEIERMILTSSDLNRLADQLRKEIQARFAIPFARVCLAKGTDYFMENRLSGSGDEDENPALCFVDPEKISAWFGESTSPVLRESVDGVSELLDGGSEEPAIQSEALIPIVVGETTMGAIVLGSEKPKRFHSGLRTDFLERMAGKLAIAIKNILLIDRLRRQSVIDKQTGLYNRSYLDSVLNREFERSKRKEKSLACLKLNIDYYEDLLDTWGETAGERILKDIGKILRSHCRVCDILIRTDISRFLVLLPETGRDDAVQIGLRIRNAVGSLHYKEYKGFERAGLSAGVAVYPGDKVVTPEELLRLANRELASNPQRENKRAV